MIKPHDLERWWASYTRFVLYYARIAQSEGVSIYSVGSELVSMESMRSRWIELIRKVRKVYKGKLLYSANWDHYEPVSFWDQVDYVGVTGYYKLTDRVDPTPDQLEKAWRAIRSKLERWRSRVKRPLVFTELGYHSRDGTNKHPWDYTTTAPIDLQEQYDCYDAFVRTWNGASSLGGVYFWIWWGPGGPSDGHYTPRGKPAVEVLRHYYGAPRRPIQRPGEK